MFSLVMVGSKLIVGPLLIFDSTWFCFSFLKLFLVFDSVEAAGMSRQFFYFTWRNVVVLFNTVVVVALQAKIQLWE